MRTLVRIKHGSHLYGTSTPASDTDIKAVHVPSARDILLQRADQVVDRKIKISTGLKNNSLDTDEQSYSVRKFLEMLMAGDTNAAEILFAPEAAILEASKDWPALQQAGRALLNRQCRGFVGYCRRQAAKYGIKGSRMAAVRQLLDILERSNPNEKLSDIQDVLKAFGEAQEHAAWVNIPSPNGSDMWHIECCDRKMPTTVFVKEAQAVYAKVWDNYGERARAAMTNEGIDWKAVSHAVRVARQAIELLSTGEITFPRPDAAELLEIKLGQRPYSEISALLEQLMQDVEEAATNSSLPEKSSTYAMEKTVIDFYLTPLQGYQS